MLDECFCQTLTPPPFQQNMDDENDQIKGKLYLAKVCVPVCVSVCLLMRFAPVCTCVLVCVYVCVCVCVCVCGLCEPRGIPVSSILGGKLEEEMNAVGKETCHSSNVIIVLESRRSDAGGEPAQTACVNSGSLGGVSRGGSG